MKRILKYKVPFEDEFVLRMPEGAEILSVQAQYGALYLWALVDEADHAITFRRFRLLGTGQPVDDIRATDHVGTVMMGEGAFVWHLFTVGT